VAPYQKQTNYLQDTVGTSSAAPCEGRTWPAKHTALVDALAVALKARGADDLSAVLAARTGVAAFVRAAICWLEDPGFELEEAARRGALRFEDAVV
jgi:hypothetical protein